MLTWKITQSKCKNLKTINKRKAKGHETELANCVFIECEEIWVDSGNERKEMLKLNVEIEITRCHEMKGNGVFRRVHEVGRTEHLRTHERQQPRDACSR